ncbi:MAG: redoxin domain-containing protein, partial [Gemmatimonadaceae bacterium]|nr:redoxin domain-containing protein [Gloeobacterales cyanobacterium ES-bin-141]
MAVLMLETFEQEQTMGVEVGQMAPDFTLSGSQGTTSLLQYRGKTNVLLAFYPGD